MNGSLSSISSTWFPANSHSKETASTYLNQFTDSNLSIESTIYRRNKIIKHRVYDLLSISKYLEIQNDEPGVISSSHSLISPYSYTHCLSLEKLEYRYLLSGKLNGKISLYDLELDSYKKILKKEESKGQKVYPVKVAINNSTANSASFSALGQGISSIQWLPTDSGVFISSSLSGKVSIYDANIFESVYDFHFNEKTKASGRELGPTFRNQDRKTAHQRSSLKCYCARLSSGNGSTVTAGLVAAALSDSSVRLCDTRSGDCSHSFLGHTRDVTSVDWCCSSMGPYQLASASMDGTVRVWDIRRAGPTAVIKVLDWREDHTHETKFDKNRLTVKRKLKNSHEILFENAARKKLYKYSYPSAYNRNLLQNSLRSSQRSSNSNIQQHTDLTVAYVPDIGDSCAIDQMNQYSCTAHDAEIMSLKYSSCGNYIVSAGNDMKIRSWHSQTGKLTDIVYTAGCFTRFPFSFEIASLSDRAVDDCILFPATGEMVHANYDDTSHEKVDIQNGDILMIPLHGNGGVNKVLKGHLGMVTTSVYRKPYQQIISSSRDGLILSWEPMSEEEFRKENKPKPIKRDLASQIMDSYNLTEKSSGSYGDDNYGDSTYISESSVEDDNWSNSTVEVDNEGVCDDTEKDNIKKSRKRKQFLPPIIQQYLDDANVSNLNTSTEVRGNDTEFRRIKNLSSSRVKLRTSQGIRLAKSLFSRRKKN